MKKIITGFLFWLLLSGAVSLLTAQQKAPTEPFRFQFRLGLEAEIFKRDITYDEAQSTTPLNSYFTTLRLEAEIADGYVFSLIGGYASSNYKSLIFRQLPFSIEFEGGGLGGTLFGAELSKVFPFNSFGVGGQVRFLSYSGSEKKWLVPDLAVEGELKSTPSWQELSAGPVLAYLGYENFIPFLSVQYNYLSGKFILRELIENLTGEETKEIKAKAKFSLSAGATLILSSHLSFRGEATYLPHKGGSDWSLNLRGIFSF